MRRRTASTCAGSGYGSFSRSMTLPAGVDPSQIEAKVKHGVAEVTMSKKASVTITPIGG
jgi:HSP20 family molecular chaperone IbpA